MPKESPGWITKRVRNKITPFAELFPVVTKLFEEMGDAESAKIQA